MSEAFLNLNYLFFTKLEEEQRPWYSAYVARLTARLTRMNIRKMRLTRYKGGTVLSPKKSCALSRAMRAFKDVYSARDIKMWSKIIKKSWNI